MTRAVRAVRDQVVPLAAMLALAYLPMLLLLFAAGWLADLKGIPMEDVTRDPATAAQAPFYTGALAILGLFGWCASAAVCFFAAAVLRHARTDRAGTAFLLSGALLSTLLLVDDAFLVHEIVGPYHLGLSDEVLIGLYGLATLAFLVGCRATILRSDYLLLVLALAFLAGSAGVDKLNDFGVLATTGGKYATEGYLFEDTLKLLGLAGWFGYFAWTAYALVTARVIPPATRAGNP